ncbi:acid phosphatase [Fusarium mundagurra]|uniref:Acid phosphatase n=1 Tax=Fusarium mundagurra TaxID=1567541 RepID=A0A8H6D748_9HYPO|nr:acid phosphatase [Fusarium mundagurra]
MATSQTPEDLNSSQIGLLLVNSDPPTSNASFSQRYKTNDRIETYQTLIDKAKNVSDDQPDDPKETGMVIRKALVSPSSKAKDKEGKVTDTEKHFPEHACWIWRWELLQLCIASGLFAAICIVLYVYTGKELPKWKNLGITLNTLVFIIATFFYISIAIISSKPIFPPFSQL